MMYKVLIADDEPIEMMIINKMILKNYENQLKIIQAANGREATLRFWILKCRE